MNSPRVDETVLTTHYRFGENWHNFAQDISSERIDKAIEGLSRLVAPHEMAGSKFLDIGSGSGLSSLAALRMNAGAVTAFDLDPDSVATTRAVLERFAPESSWQVEEASVFDLAARNLGTFDVVHSWGVLHHTGDVWRAIEACLPLVSPGGLLVLAFYRKTPVCNFWRLEKRFYSRASRGLRAVIRGLYSAAYILGILATGRNPVSYIREYPRNRGMSWMTDVEDWLGGYPYESVTSAEIDSFLTLRGFAKLRIFAKPARLAGLLGSHCDEFVYRRVD